MLVSVVDALSQEGLCTFGSSDGYIPQPQVGDILVLPDGTQCQVLQRAFICIEKSVLQLAGVPSAAPGQRQIDFEIRCAVAPLADLNNYRRKLEEIANAGT